MTVARAVIRVREGLPSAVKRVFLHIGAPKTGTTFLQDTLWRNREQLRQDGFLIPYTDEHQHFRSSRDFCGGGWGQLPPEHFAGEWAAVAGAARDWDGSTVIISNELLAGADPGRIAAGLESLQPAEVHIVFTMRDLARQLVSDWQEHIKHLHTITLEDFVEVLITDGIDAQPPFGEMFWGLHDPLHVLPKWRDHVPPERIHVVTGPPRGSSSGGLWQRFCEPLGMDPSRYATTATRANRSMGVAETELIRRVNLAVPRMPQGVYEPLVRQYLAQEVLGDRSGRLTLPPQFLPWVMQRSQEMVDRLQAEGYSLTGDWTDLLPRPEDHETFTSPTALTERDLGEASLRATVGLVKRAGEQRQTIATLNARVQGLPPQSVERPPLRRRIRARAGRLRRYVVTRLRRSSPARTPLGPQ